MLPETPPVPHPPTATSAKANKALEEGKAAAEARAAKLQQQVTSKPQAGTMAIHFSERLGQGHSLDTGGGGGGQQCACRNSFGVIFVTVTNKFSKLAEKMLNYFSAS